MNDLVKRFCTPPFMELTNFDKKSLSTANKTKIDFERGEFPLYSWGAGEKVLLVHGWGSRASHMSLLARSIADAGFNVYTFDVPAHSSDSIPSKNISSMFEFGYTIYSAAKHIGNIHTVVGHSLGAIALLFSLSGFMKFKPLKFYTKKAVLVSSPSSLESIISSFCRSNKLTEIERKDLEEGLEDEFNFKINDYSILKGLKNIPADLLLIHDKDDDEIPISDAYEIKKIFPRAHLHLTKGLGHSKILFNKEVIHTAGMFIGGKLS